MRSGQEIRASALVAAPRDEVFEFLADLRNHWLLADRFIEVLTLEPEPDGRCVGGRVRMRGPLGVRRTASTQVLAADPPHQMIGTAQIGAGTRAFVRWKLTTSSAGSRVSLEATIDQARALDRLLLVLGGRRWLARRFASVLERLAERFRIRVDPKNPPAAAGRPLSRARRRALRGKAGGETRVGTDRRE